jgi:serine phosphatase RsbU (regulator of sigma subunit)
MTLLRLDSAEGCGIWTGPAETERYLQTSLACEDAKTERAWTVRTLCTDAAAELHRGLVGEQMTNSAHVRPARGDAVPPQRQTPRSGLAPARMAVLRTTGVLDSATQDFWNGLTTLAARLLRAPVAVLTILDGSLALPLSQGRLDGRPFEALDIDIDVAASLCVWVGDATAPIVVEDAGPETDDDPDAATTRRHPRAWIGCPLTDVDRRVTGSFCVVDVEPRLWTQDQVDVLDVLARSASAQLSFLAANDAERAAQDDLAGVRESERLAETRLERLAFVALELLGAETIEDLTEIVVNNGLPVLGADGGAVIMKVDDQVLKAALSARLGEDVQGTFGQLPVDDPLPAAYVARTGERLVFPTRESGLQFAPEMARMYDATQRRAWVFTPLNVGGRLLGSLAASWVEEREFSHDELTVLDAFAAQCAQALDRIRLAAEQREITAQMQRLSVALQRGLLTQPVTPDDLDIAFRYLPAVHDAQIGGDWYDAFRDYRGATLISVGDVAGHDRNAAASMAQLRNVLRGLAIDSDDSPALLLSRLDRAIARLGLETLATSVVARIEPGPTGGAEGRRVCWSSAGHMPPLLRSAGGEVTILDESADLLLGLDARTKRSDHVFDLPNGSTLLLYTDGLVERRGESLDDGLHRLADAFAAASPQPEDVTEQLLASMLPEPPEDDVVLLVVRPGT